LVIKKDISMVAAWNWVDTAAANDYYEIMWSSTGGNMTISAFASGSTPTRPTIPSVIATIHRVDVGGITYVNSSTGQLIVSASTGNALTVAGTTTLNGSLSVSSGITGSISATNGVVSGSSQILGGTGIISSSAQLNNTTITNLTVTNLTTVNETASVLFSSGSNRFGDFGDDVHDFTGSVKISGSFTLVGSSTATSYNGTINSTNGVVSGSSQVIGILSSLNTYTGSNDTKHTTLATYTASLDTKNSTLATYTASLDTKFTTLANVTSSLIAATSSYETKGRGIVSGSSQIDVMSTTNIARLATTGSNIFIGNQTITGSIFTTGTGNNLINAVTTQAFASGFNDSVFILAPNQTGGGLSFNIGKSASSYNLGKMVFNYVGDQSTSNNISFGFYNYDNKLVIEGGGTVRPGANGTQDLGSSSNRWSTVYTSDLSLNNGIGDWTIVEGEDDLFLYNNKKGKVYKFALTEVDPNVATPKKS
jgi:hypothetical protein